MHALTRLLSLTALLMLGLGNATQASERVTFYHADALGSPILATDETGAVKWRESYTPYGSRLTYEARQPQETTWDEKQWYTGKLEESRQGIQYFGARWYDPSIGRFLSVDPVNYIEGNPFSFNRYAYANNNPYRYVDPDGQLPILVPLALAYAAFEAASTAYDAYTAAVTVTDAQATTTEKAISVGTVLAGVGLPGPGRLYKESAEAVTKYDVGTFGDLRRRSTVGDNLDIHHVPQRHPAGQAIDGYDPATGPSIAVPSNEHRRIPTLRGQYEGNARDLLAKDIKDLRNYTNAPNSALQDLVRLNKEANPSAFNK